MLVLVLVNSEAKRLLFRFKAHGVTHKSLTRHNLPWISIPALLFDFSGPIQPITGRRRFSWPDGQLLVDAALWSTEYFVVCFVPQQYPFSWKCTHFHDDICLGSSQRRRQDGVSRFLDLPCALFTMGHVDLQCDAGALDYDGFDWHYRGTRVLLFRVCVSSHGGN